MPDAFSRDLRGLWTIPVAPTEVHKTFTLPRFLGGDSFVAPTQAVTAPKQLGCGPCGTSDSVTVPGQGSAPVSSSGGILGPNVATGFSLSGKENDEMCTETRPSWLWLLGAAIAGYFVAKQG